MDLQVLAHGFEKLRKTLGPTKAEYKSYLLISSVGFGVAFIITWLLFIRSFEPYVLSVWAFGFAAAFIGYFFSLLKSVKEGHIRSFAVHHGLHYSSAFPMWTTNYDGVIFGLGNRQHIRHYFWNTPPNVAFSVFTYQFSETDYTSRKVETRSYSVARFLLDKEIPHLLLDSKRNEKFLTKSIPRSLSDEYRVSLEGDFDKYFTLYTAFPRPAEALTIITPEVMQALMHLAPEVDIEITNKTLLVFMPNQGLANTRFLNYQKVLLAAHALFNSAHLNLHHYTMDNVSMNLTNQNIKKGLLYGDSRARLLGFILFALGLAIGGLWVLWGTFR